MAVLLSDGFHSDPRVAIAGDRAIGTWIRMLSWLSQWPDEVGIPRTAQRMFGGTPRVVEALRQAQLLLVLPDVLQPLADGDLWRVNRTVCRPKIPDALRALVMERDEYRCQFCSAVDKLSLDHITPWSLGGPDTEENLRVLCRSCNSSRGNRVEAASAARDR